MCHWLQRRRQLKSSFSVGGLVVNIEGPGYNEYPVDLSPFLASTTDKPSFFCSSRHERVAAIKKEDLLFDSDGVWKVGRGDQGLRLVLHASGRPYHALELNPDLDKAIAFLDTDILMPGEKHFPLRAPMHELWSSFLLMRGRGLLLHGCGWLCEDGVRVFVGQSGAGKSTLAGILSKHSPGQILSDDRLILRPDPKGGYRIYGTPWHGELQHALPRSGKLLSIDFLAKAEKARRRPLPKALAAARLCSVCFLAGWPRTDLVQVLDRCAEVVESVEASELAFAPDPSVLDALR